MKELVEKVNQLVAEFLKDAEAQIENGNKAAGTRARKASLEIEKSMKKAKVRLIRQVFEEFQQQMQPILEKYGLNTDK